MSEGITVLCACRSDEQARAIADTLVERRLAACVQAVPIASTYRWDGQVQRDSEVLLLAKTVASAFDEVAVCIRSLHDYAVPEIVALLIVAGTPDYLNWLHGQVSA